MNPHAEVRLEKVKRTSRSARRVCYLLMAFVSLAATLTAIAALTIPESISCDFAGLHQPCSELSPQALAFALVALLGGVALFVVALHRLARLFAHYARGEIFTRLSVRELRWLGYVAVAYAVFRFAQFVVALALVAGGGVESPADLRLELPLGPAILAGFLLLLSWIMDVGAEMREENELTV